MAEERPVTIVYDPLNVVVSAVHEGHVKDAPRYRYSRVLFTTMKDGETAEAVAYRHEHGQREARLCSS